MSFYLGHVVDSVANGYDGVCTFVFSDDVEKFLLVLGHLKHFGFTPGSCYGIMSCVGRVIVYRVWNNWSVHFSQSISANHN